MKVIFLIVWRMKQFVLCFIIINITFENKVKKKNKYQK